MNIERLPSVDEVADRLGVSPKTLRDRGYRARIGLKGIKIGKRVRFTEKDLARFIDDKRERATEDSRVS